MPSNEIIVMWPADVEWNCYPEYKIPPSLGVFPDKRFGKAWVWLDSFKIALSMSKIDMYIVQWVTVVNSPWVSLLSRCSLSLWCVPPPQMPIDHVTAYGTHPDVHILYLHTLIFSLSQIVMSLMFSCCSCYCCFFVFFTLSCCLK